MEYVEKAQTLLVQNALYVGIGLGLALLLAGFMWYSMSRNAGSKSVLTNEARMNAATTDVPADSMRDDPNADQPEQPPMTQEELERQLAAIAKANGGNAEESE
jgi:hypothetical protein